MIMTQTRNVVFIGETGSGKSSVINLITGHDYAAVSPDAKPYTTTFASYDVFLAGWTYRLWDTPGLNTPSKFWLFRRSLTVGGQSIKPFLQDRHRCQELDLLVLCVRGSRANEGMSRAYKIFCRATRQFAIPVVIALTHLERQQPTVETWWQKNERMLGDLQWASQREARNLISSKYPQRPQSTIPDQEYLDVTKSCVVC